VAAAAALFLPKGRKAAQVSAAVEPVRELSPAAEPAQELDLVR